MRNLLFFSLFFPLLLQAQQTTLNGVITVLNSRFDQGRTEYVAFAEVQESSRPDKVPVCTDAKGRFQIEIDRFPAFLEVSKAGYLIVNPGKLQINAGQKDTLCLLMVNKEKITEAEQIYFDIAYSAAEKNLLRLFEEQQKNLEAMKIQVDPDPSQIASLQKEVTMTYRQFSKLDPLADDITGACLQDVDNASPLFQDAFRLFRNGNPDEALNMLQPSNLTGYPDDQKIRMLGFAADLYYIRMEWDSAEQCYKQMLLLDDKNLFSHRNFTWFLLHQNRTNEARVHHKKCLSLVTTEIDSAYRYIRLGYADLALQESKSGEQNLLRGLAMMERLHMRDPAQYDSDLAWVCNNLGNFYYNAQRMAEGEEMLQRAFSINERLVLNDPNLYGRQLAEICVDLAKLYFETNRKAESEKLLLHSMDLLQKLAKTAPIQFEPRLATAQQTLASVYNENQKRGEAEKMLVQNLQTWERLAKRNAPRFEPEVAMTAAYLGEYYYQAQNIPESEKMFLRALELYERLVQWDSVSFEPALAWTMEFLGLINYTQKDLPKSEMIYLRALKLYERQALTDPVLYEPGIARIEDQLGNLYYDMDKFTESEKSLLRAFTIWDRLSQSDLAKFGYDLSNTIYNLGTVSRARSNLEEGADWYSRFLILQKKRLINVKNTSWESFNYVYKNTAMLRDTLASHGSYSAAVALQKVRAECMDALWHLDIYLIHKAAADFGNLSWLLLFTHQYAEAEKAAQKALELDADQHWVKTNLGHSHLLRGNLKKAKRAYREYLDEDGEKAKSLLLKDLDQLEAASITHADLIKVRKWLHDFSSLQ
ncbi:MAG: tetratricopeptide repeat protein [Saprospiraceae bacterium]